MFFESVQLYTASPPPTRVHKNVHRLYMKRLGGRSCVGRQALYKQTYYVLTHERTNNVKLIQNRATYKRILPISYVLVAFLVA